MEWEEVMNATLADGEYAIEENHFLSALWPASTIADVSNDHDYFLINPTMGELWHEEQCVKLRVRITKTEFRAPFAGLCMISPTFCLHIVDHYVLDHDWYIVDDVDAHTFDILSEYLHYTFPYSGGVKYVSPDAPEGFSYKFEGPDPQDAACMQFSAAAGTAKSVFEYLKTLSEMHKNAITRQYIADALLSFVDEETLETRDPPYVDFLNLQVHAEAYLIAKLVYDFAEVFINLVCLVYRQTSEDHPLRILLDNIGAFMMPVFVTNPKFAVIFTNTYDYGSRSQQVQIDTGMYNTDTQIDLCNRFNPLNFKFSIKESVEENDLRGEGEVSAGTQQNHDQYQGQEPNPQQEHSEGLSGIPAPSL
ncbi:hypothetical protein GGR54DRAFT_652166 [Hypoxylon sp. NC1633]|nr:hypothetical protein GGR54DRAFT_652166 [Hypoxylon sp. NC1633]